MLGVKPEYVEDVLCGITNEKKKKRNKQQKEIAALNDF